MCVASVNDADALYEHAWDDCALTASASSVPLTVPEYSALVRADVHLTSALSVPPEPGVKVRDTDPLPAGPSLLVVVPVQVPEIATTTFVEIGAPASDAWEAVTGMAEGVTGEPLQANIASAPANGRSRPIRICAPSNPRAEVLPARALHGALSQRRCPSDHWKFLEKTRKSAAGAGSSGAKRSRAAAGSSASRQT